MSLLLHTCCAPCSVYCVKKIRQENIEPTLYWFNPNIHPFAEYKARRDCLRSYAQIAKIKLLEEDAYGLDEFICQTYDKIATRCVDYCYPTRLRHACAFARQNGFTAISTTLLYSIYQKHDYICELLDGLAKEYDLDFVYYDFRAGWREGQNEARRLGLYMQKYCGCVFSEEESMLGRQLAKKMQKHGLAPTNTNVRKFIEQSKRDGLVVPSKII